MTIPLLTQIKKGKLYIFLQVCLLKKDLIPSFHLDGNPGYSISSYGAPFDPM